MDLRRELSLMMGSLVLLNVLLAFGVIGLLVRMGPAIERILQENVYSVVAAEEILVELASSPPGITPPAAATARIDAALARAKSNVTEPAELPILARIDASLAAERAGAPGARGALVGAVKDLIEINQRAMGKVDREAQQLGRAGAWAAVLVGLLSFMLSLFVLGRMRRRFAAPLLELHAVLEAALVGERFRRCQHRDAPVEVRRVLASVNRILDDRLKQELATEP
jgi:hypothetical protein